MLLYRPVGMNGLRKVFEAKMTGFPARLPGQPIFYPVLSREYAEEIALKWNAREAPFAGYVTEFEVGASYVSRFARHVVGSSTHEELWIPAGELEEFNRHITPPIRVISAFFGLEFAGFVPERYILKGKSALEQLRCMSEVLEYSGFDFSCEISANRLSIFLNYAFWRQCDSEAAGLTEERKRRVLQGVEFWWHELVSGIMLPLFTESVG